MTEREFTNEEVIRALECCVNGECDECPYQDDSPCKEYLNNAALDLINRQRAEIAALVSAVDNSTKEFLKLHDDYQDQKAEIERLQWGEYRHIGKTVLNARNEAIEEFAERLKRHRVLRSGCVPWYDIQEIIKTLEKELTEGKPCTDGADCSTCENCYHDGGYNECATDGVK